MELCKPRTIALSITVVLLGCGTERDDRSPPGVNPPVGAGGSISQAGSGGGAGVGGDTAGSNAMAGSGGAIAGSGGDQAGSGGVGGGGPGGEACAAPPSDLPTDITVTMNGRKHTLGDFKHPQLMPRKVNVLLPLNYTDTEKYPVIYVYDGVSYAQPASDELDKLIAAGKPVSPHIIVGIESSNDRVNELAPWVQTEESPTFEVQKGQGGKGAQLHELVVNVIKPYVESHYSTLCGRENTTVMGWSLGGLMCMYGMLTAPEAFGRGHCISGSYWWNGEQMVDEWRNYQGPTPVRLWIDVGGAESYELMVGPARQVRDISIENGLVLGENLGYFEQPGGDHNGGAARFSFTLWSIMDLAVQLHDADATSFELSATTAMMSMAFGPKTSNVSANRTYDGGYKMTLPNENFTLSSDAPDVATVDATGVITAVSAGSASITATQDAATASVDVSVL